MFVNFCNPGEIDINAVTTLGVNVKSSDSPIGFFGTGLKFAIATLLRNGQRISIWSGAKFYTFLPEAMEVRGKPFERIVMLAEGGKTPLGFTTDLGKNWTLAEAYRELYSNCMDEGGEITTEPREPAEGFTIISVSGAEFFSTHFSRDGFILNKEKLKLLEEGKAYEVQVYEGSSSAVFYRGIKVLTLEKPTAFTYNILSPLELTEDRTVKYDFQCIGVIQAFLAFECKSPDIIAATLLHDCRERDLGIPSHGAWSETFENTAVNIAATAPDSLEPNTREKVFRKTREITGKYVDFELSPDQKAKLDSTLSMLLSAGIPVLRYPIRFVESCGSGVVGIADLSSKTIFLARAAFSRSDLATTILEEFYHLQSGFGDCTRWFQDHLLAEISRLAKELASRPAKLDDETEF